MRKTLIPLLFLSLAVCAGPLVHAQARPAGGNIEFKNIAEVETEVKAADGKTEKKRGPVQKAVPGTVIFYTSTFKNVSAKPAGNISINNPVPANTTLVAASAYGENMDIGYSADGGKTWAAADKLKVKGADGKERAAALSEITHIRWNQRNELAPGKQGEAGFRVVVN
ncbi:MAG: conserved repeat domain [Rhodoferax sp.]|nr:conserved repeat domain [Rhodoferax sp.]